MCLEEEPVQKRANGLVLIAQLGIELVQREQALLVEQVEAALSRRLEVEVVRRRVERGHLGHDARAHRFRGRELRAADGVGEEAEQVLCLGHFRRL